MALRLKQTLNQSLPLSFVTSQIHRVPWIILAIICGQLCEGKKCVFLPDESLASSTMTGSQEALEATYEMAEDTRK